MCRQLGVNYRECKQLASKILAINAGSSSIKFALYRAEVFNTPEISGALERIGTSGTSLSIRHQDHPETSHRKVGDLDAAGAVKFLFGWIDNEIGLEAVTAAGHRLVHSGPDHAGPALITPALLDDLRELVPFAPEHLPAAIKIIEHLSVAAQRLKQVACFDTSFHWHMPKAAKNLPIPRRYGEMGVRRYGFHGLSYAYLMEELARLEGPLGTKGRIVLAHLGNGASLCALKDGQSIDTSMAFTPASGIPMSTRSGDLDPGLLAYLARTEHLDAAGFDRMVNHQSGLLGISGTSSNMADLLEIEKSDPHAAEAVELFCYAVKKQIGAYAAALGGLDTLVFSGGIGEHAPSVRARICAGLGFLGIKIEPTKNAAHAPLISVNFDDVAVRVIPTKEERMIAQTTSQVLADLSKHPNQRGSRS